MFIRTIISAFVVSFCVAQNNGFVARQWKVEDGLPQSTVRCITQDADGYLWVGTWQGLARFDGVRMTVFKSSNTPALNSSNIMSLGTDDSGRVWIGTDQGGIVRYARGRFTRFDSAAGCPAKRILSVAQDRSGRMWFATEIGIFSFDGSRFLHFTEEDGLPHSYANQVLPLSDGSVYLGFVGTGSIVRLVDDSLMVQESFPVGGYAVAADSAGVIWFGDRKKGLVRRERGRETSDRSYTAPMPGETHILRNGEKWLLTSSDIRIIAGAEKQTLQKVEDIALSDITTVFEDLEGNIWLGKEGGGLILLRRKKVSVLSRRNGFPSDLIESGLEDRSGTTWIATWDAGLLKMTDRDADAVTAVRFPVPVPSVFTLTESMDGTLWAGTWGHGLFAFRNGRAERLVRGIVDNATSIVSIAEDRQGGMWVATAHEGIQYFRGADEKVWNTASGLSGNRVNALLAARNGDLWATISGNGVNRISGGAVTVFRKGAGLNDDFASPLYEDTAGSIWIGTYNGLARWKDGEFRFVTEENGLFDGAVAQIIEDGLGYLWIGAIHGIYRVNMTELNAAADGSLRTVRCFTIGKEDGMLNEETSAGGTPRCWKSRDGRLHFTTSAGVVSIDPRVVAENSLPPKVVIEQIWVENKPVPVSEQAVLQSGESKVEMMFTGIHFTAPSKIRFQYRLVGLDDEWVAAGTKRFAQYTNLGPGEYTFLVRAENNAGVPSERDATLRIVVLPPFYATWWFRSLIALFFVSVGPAVYSYRVRQLTAEKERQVEFSRRLIESQETERKRIASELHDGLGQNLLIIKNKLLVALQSLTADTAPAQQVAEASVIVSGTIEEVRSISHNLRPHQLDYLGLTKTLRSVVHQATESTNIGFTVLIADIDGLLSPKEEIGLFRIVQESFNNILKHAEATAVSVEVHRRERTIEILIADDGKGITGSGGFGISGMHERASMFSWSLSIAPRQPKGTTVSLTIPVRP